MPLFKRIYKTCAVGRIKFSGKLESFKYLQSKGNGMAEHIKVMVWARRFMPVAPAFDRVE